MKTIEKTGIWLIIASLLCTIAVAITEQYWMLVISALLGIEGWFFWSQVADKKTAWAFNKIMSIIVTAITNTGTFLATYGIKEIYPGIKDLFSRIIEYLTSNIAIMVISILSIAAIIIFFYVNKLIAEKISKG